MAMSEDLRQEGLRPWMLWPLEQVGLGGVLFRNVMFPSFDYSAAIDHMRTFVLDHLRAGAK
jgi:hypothetical protein